MVDPELIYRLAKKVKIPNAIRIGMFLSVVTFEAFDIKSRAMRWIIK